MLRWPRKAAASLRHLTRVPALTNQINSLPCSLLLLRLRITRYLCLNFALCCRGAPCAAVSKAAAVAARAEQERILDASRRGKSLSFSMAIGGKKKK